MATAIYLLSKKDDLEGKFITCVKDDTKNTFSYLSPVFKIRRLMFNVDDELINISADHQNRALNAKYDNNNKYYGLCLKEISIGKNKKNVLNSNQFLRKAAKLEYPILSKNILKKIYLNNVERNISSFRNIMNLNLNLVPISGYATLLKSTFDSIEFLKNLVYKKNVIRAKTLNSNKIVIGDKLLYNGDNYCLNQYEIDAKTIASFTGFYDRNFKKIFVDSKFKYYSTKIFKLNNSFFVLFKNNGLTLPLFDVYQDLEVC